MLDGVQILNPTDGYPLLTIVDSRSCYSTGRYSRAY